MRAQIGYELEQHQHNQHRQQIGKTERGDCGSSLVMIRTSSTLRSAPFGEGRWLVGSIGRWLSRSPTRY